MYGLVRGTKFLEDGMALVGTLSMSETLPIKVPGFAWKKMPREHFGLLQKKDWFSCANRRLSCTRRVTESWTTRSGLFAKGRTARCGSEMNAASPESTGVELSALSPSPEEPLMRPIAASGQNGEGAFGPQKIMLVSMRAWKAMRYQPLRQNYCILYCLRTRLPAWERDALAFSMCARMLVCLDSVRMRHCRGLRQKFSFQCAVSVRWWKPPMDQSGWARAEMGLLAFDMRNLSILPRTT